MRTSIQTNGIEPSSNSGNHGIDRQTVTITGDISPGNNTAIWLNQTESIQLCDLIQKGKLLDFRKIDHVDWPASINPLRFENQIGYLILRYGDFAGQSYEVPLLFDTKNSLLDRDHEKATEHLLENLELGTLSNPETLHKSGKLDRDQGDLGEYDETIPLSDNIREQLSSSEMSNQLENIRLQAELAKGSAKALAKGTDAKSPSKTQPNQQSHSSTA